MEKVTSKARGAVAAGTLAFGILVAGGVGVAQAGVLECLADIDSVRTALNGTDDPKDKDCESVGIGGGNIDRTCASLNSKLDSASRKLNEYKAADALQNLEDFVMKIEDMYTAAKPKIDDGNTTVVALINAGITARNCVCELVLADGGFCEPLPPY